MSRNMCKLCHKVHNGHFYHIKVQMSRIIILGFHFFLRLSKTYSINPYLKNTLGLYIFERLRQETKILFEKSELNFSSFTWTLLCSGKMNGDIMFSFSLYCVVSAVTKRSILWSTILTTKAFNLNNTCTCYMLLLFQGGTYKGVTETALWHRYL